MIVQKRDVMFLLFTKKNNAFSKRISDLTFNVYYVSFTCPKLSLDVKYQHDKKFL